MVVASPGIATASADTTDSSTTSSDAAPDPGPKADPDPADSDAEVDEDADVDEDSDEPDEDADSEAGEPDADDPGDDAAADGDDSDPEPEPIPEPEPAPPAANRNDDDAAEPVDQATTTSTTVADEPTGETPEVVEPVADAPSALMVTLAVEDEEKSPWDFLPEYPEIAGVTKTEVAAVVFIAAAAVTVVSIPTAPLLTIPLLLLSIAAWARLEELGTNHHAPTATVDNKVRLLGVVTETLIGHDEDGDPVNITLENGPSNGSVEIIGTPSLGFQYIYTANNPFTVGAINDSFTVKVDDFGGWRNHPLGMHSTTVTINVADGGLGINLPPVVLPVSAGIPDRAGVVRSSILGTDPEGGPLTYTLANGQQSIVTSKGGIVHLDGEDYIYIPSQAGGGLLNEIFDSFEVDVSDGDNATVTVTVGILTKELEFDFLSVLDEDSHTVTGEIDAPANDIGLFAYAVGNVAAHGGVTVDPVTGAYTYVAGDTPQNDSFTVVGTDIHGNAVTLTVEVSPFAPNRPPEVVPVGAGVSLGGSGVVTGTVLGTDPDGDPVHYSVAGYGGSRAAVLSNGGAVVVDSDGKWTYIPPVDGGGIFGAVVDDFRIYVTDGRGGQASTDIVVLTHDLAIGYTADVSGTTVTGGLDIPSGLAGLFSYAKGNGPGKGDVTVSSDGTYEYTSNLTGHGTPGTDTFTIVGVIDGLEVTIASVTVTPALPNQNPTGTFTVTETSSTNLGALSVASASGTIDVSDLDGDTSFTYVVSGSLPVAPTVGTSTKGGVVVINGDGTFDYASSLGLPHSSAPGGTTDTFTVTVLDGYGGSAEVVVTVPIASVNNNPTHVNTTGASGRDLFQKVGGWVTTVADLDLDTVTATSTTTTKGSVSISKTAGYVFTVTYTSFTNPSIPFTKAPSETFTVTYADGLGGAITRSYTF